jgi:hypothetical protein
MWLVYVELSGACFSFQVTSDGWVIQAAPIAAWTIGRRGRKVVGHYRRRGGRVSWQQVPHRLCYAGDDAGLLRCLVYRGPRALPTPGLHLRPHRRPVPQPVRGAHGRRSASQRHICKRSRA